jgi:hypothetical protein
MSFFTAQQRKVEIEGPGGMNTVTVRKLTYGEQQGVISASTSVDMSGGNTDANIKIDPAKMQELQLVAAIVSWEGPDFDRPLNKANVLALPPTVAAAITAGVEALNEPIDDAEKNA